MSAFMILSLGAEEVGASIQSTYPVSNMILAHNAWLVADFGVTTQEVCKKLNIGPGGINAAIVVKIDGYFGMANNSVWEWLRVKSRDATPQ